MLWLGYILKGIIFEEVLVPQNTLELGFCVKKINVFICLKTSYFHVFFNFSGT